MRRTGVGSLVTMGGMTANGEWRTYDYIPFQKLHKGRKATSAAFIAERAYLEIKEGFLCMPLAKLISVP